MINTLQTLIQRLDRAACSGSGIIPWSCPVPSFGEPTTSELATLGLNPSNREFVDISGRELDGSARRFHTLTSLNLQRWSDAKPRHLDLIAAACSSYFTRNPYDAWFKKLDKIIAGAGMSFYGVFANACHLDLIPYATARKWTELRSSERRALITLVGDTHASLIRDSSIRALILNGSSVIKYFQALSGVRLHQQHMKAWTLLRHGYPAVPGVAYFGTTRVISGYPLSRELLILGFNHNLQSTFGITTEVIRSIGAWIGHVVTGTRS